MNTHLKTQNKFRAMILAIIIVSASFGFLFGYQLVRANGESNKIFETPTDSYSYLVWVESGTYYAKNGLTGAIDYSGTNLLTLLTTVEGVVDDNGGTIYLKGIEAPSSLTISSNVIIIQEVNGKYSIAQTSSVETPAKYFASDGAGSESINSPHGVYYNGKTYVVYATNPTYDVYAMVYNHVSKSWSEPVLVHSGIGQDFHYYPAIINTADGKLHVFYGSHNSQLKHSVSTYAENISAWTTLSDLATPTSTYVNLVTISNGDLYVFSREDNIGTYRLPEGYWKSTDNGLTFSSFNRIIDPEEDYATYVYSATYDSANGRIWLSWNLYQNSISTYRYRYIYAAYLKLSDGHMYAPDGTDEGTTLSKAEMDAKCIVWDGGSGNKAFQPILRLNSVGTPFIIFQNRTTGTPLKLHAQFTGWSGAVWTTPVTILGSIAKNYFNVAFTFTGTSTIEVLGIMHDEGYVSEPYENDVSGDVVKYSSTNSGSTWSIQKVVLPEGMAYGSVNVVLLVGNYDNSLKYLFESSNYIFGGFNYSIKFKIWAYGDNGFV